MGHAGHHSTGSAAGAKSDSSQVVAEFIRLIAAIVLVTRAQSTVSTAAPALHGAVVEQRTSVGSTRTQRHCRATGPERHRREGSAHFTSTVTNVVLCAGA